MSNLPMCIIDTIYDFKLQLCVSEINFSIEINWIVNELMRIGRKLDSISFPNDFAQFIQVQHDLKNLAERCDYLEKKRQKNV